MNDRLRLPTYAVAFSLAFYLAAAVLSIGTGAYKLSVFYDPLLNSTLPLLVLSIAFQVIDRRGTALALGVVIAALFAISSMLFLTISELAAGVLTELSAGLVGYRGLKASVINTSTFGLTEGALSVPIGSLFLRYDVPPLAFLAFLPALAVVSACMGLAGEILWSHISRAG